jgi:ribosomal-protein-alanine N-acetyltransferase
MKTVKIECAVAFTLRDAEPDDLETLWRIDQKCFSAGIAYSRAELKFFMRRRGAFTLVALADSEDDKKDDNKDDNGERHEDDHHHDNAAGRKIAGFIVAHAAAAGHIITIDVAASARRSGIGSQLLRAAEDRLRHAGARAVSLETAVDNTGALSFYKRHGYEIIEALPAYYADGADALVLRKQLKTVVSG